MRSALRPRAKNNKMRGAERVRVALASRTEGGAGRERPDAANLDDAVVARVLAVRVRRGRDAIGESADALGERRQVRAVLIRGDARGADLRDDDVRAVARRREVAGGREERDREHESLCR